MKAFSLLGRVTWCPCPFPVNLQLHSLFQATTDVLYITIYEIYHFYSISGILSLSTILTHVNNHIWLIILTYTLKSASFFFFSFKKCSWPGQTFTHYSWLSKNFVVSHYPPGNWFQEPLEISKSAPVQNGVDQYIQRALCICKQPAKDGKQNMYQLKKKPHVSGPMSFEGQLYIMNIFHIPNYFFKNSFWWLHSILF